jgi:hypothetical protein
MITALYKEQVLSLTQDKKTKEIIACGINFNPRSMGVGGILTSDLFKLRTSLGLPTQELLDERRRIASKDEPLKEIERVRLRKINKELEEIEFIDSNRDPLYEIFKKEWTAKEKKEWTALPDLTDEQISEQNKLAQEIINKIRSHRNPK